MYQLTCPSCGKATQWPFVRIGASRRCDGCGTRFVIDRAHVNRHVRNPAGAKRLLGPAGDPAQVPPRVDEHGNVIGLSGLTEMMQDEPADRSPRIEDQPPPEAATVRRSSVQAVKTQQRRQDVRWLYILLGIMVAVMVLLGFSLWYATNLGPSAQRRPTTPPAAAVPDFEPDARQTPEPAPQPAPEPDPEPDPEPSPTETIPAHDGPAEP